jgi:hypothetical protein
MKKIILLLALTVLCFYSRAQLPVFKNASFENWKTVNGYLYPDDWDVTDSSSVKAGAVTRVNGGSKGSYALRLGSWNKNGTVVGGAIQISDTLTDKIGGISFDYKVQNNNFSMLNGLFLHIYFFDASQYYISDYSWSSPMYGNYSSFVIGNFTSMTCPSYARWYLLDVKYFNANGSPTEYTIIDNLTFLKNTGIYDAKNAGSTQISAFPNPASTEFSLSGLKSEETGEILLTDLAGHTRVLNMRPVITLPDVPNGLYFLSVYDKSGTLMNVVKLAIYK